MALTLAAQQQLESASLIDLFEKDKVGWKAMAVHAHDFVKNNFPPGSTVRPDDVAKALIPVIEVSETLTNYLKKKQLRQKYWLMYFADYILDRGFTENWW